MRILHIIPRFTVGGAERLVLEYAKHLPRAGFEIVVASVRQKNFSRVYPKNNNPSPYRGGVGGVFTNAEFQTPSSLPLRVGGDFVKDLVSSDFIECGDKGFWRAMKRLRSFVREWRPNVIHTHIFSSDVAGYLLKCSSAQVRWVSTQHNVARQHSWWRRAALRIILKKTDCVIAVSPRVAAELGARFGVAAEHISLIPNAIALEPWLAVPTNGLLTNKILRLATIGRLERQKGVDLLFAALSRFNDINWCLSVFGTGSLQTALKSQAGRLGIDKRITWHGVVDNLPERLQDIDIVIQPSRWEGMSLVVMEALAAGRVVIASEAAGEGLIENMKTGIVYDTETGNRKLEIRGALEWIEKNIDQAREMAERGREYASTHFGFFEHLTRIAALYQDLIRDRR